jgi:iron complex outermembrane receptor protein
VAGALLAAAPGLPARAEGLRPPSELKKLSLEQLFDLEVTSVSKKAEPLSRTAAAIHVVTGEDIHRSGSPTIPGALRAIPGVEVARIDARQYAFTVRGFNSSTANKLLVLMDGRSLYTPLFSGVFWDAQDAFLPDIERIEVIRGPGATLWGANAVNGVVNVIRAGAAHTQGLLAEGGGGNVERGFAGARYGGALGPHAFYRVYAKHFDRDGSPLRDGRDAGDSYHMNQGGFRVDWARTPADALTLQGDLYGGRAGQPGADPIRINGGNVLARWTRTFSAESDLEVAACYDRTEREVPPIFGETLDTYDVTLHHRFTPPLRQDVVWGLGYRLMRDDVENSSMLAFLPALQTLEQISGFVQDEITLTPDRLRAIVGSKFERDEYSGFEYQPSARLAWTPAGTHTVWAAASRAVRTPSRIDRGFYVPANPPYLLAGGPNFDSEVLHAYELGYKAQPGRDLSVSLATFRNLYDRLRSLEGGPPYVFANGLEGSSYGIEAEATCQVRRGWRIDAGYTYFKLDLDARPGSTDKTQILQEGDSPRDQWCLRSAADLPRATTLDVTLRRVGELPNQAVPGYVECDARVSWQPVRALEMAFVGRNLLDPRHPEFGRPAGRKEVERSLYGTVTWRR